IFYLQQWIADSLIAFNGVISLTIALTLLAHRFFLPRTMRALGRTELATTGASVIAAGAGIVALEVNVRSTGLVELQLTIVPYSQSLILLLFSFVINAVLFFISLHFWRRRRKD
ncbi:hypothetical protein PENTCL1PPCAC_16442, partial [Pristionchus entomophagus]